MSVPARLISLWRNLIHRDRVEWELDDELRQTLEALTAEKRQAGMSPAEADRAARLELGGIESVKQEVRSVRTGAVLDTIWLDTRFAARLLARNPLFTLTAALSLAVGIGAATAVFTVVNGLLLRPADGIPDPGSLVDIVRRERGSNPGIETESYPDYRDIRDRVTTIRDVYAFQVIINPASLRVDDSSERVFPNPVSINYFDALGVKPALGRLFGAGDDEAAGASPVVVLSHRYWRRRFDRDPGVVGRTVRLNGYPLTIVGVAPERFHGTTLGAPDLWLPLGMTAAVSTVEGDARLTARWDEWLLLGARLRPGMTRAQASAEIATIGAVLRASRQDDRARPGGPPAPGGVIRERNAGEFIWSVEAATPVPYGMRILVAGFVALLMGLVLVVLVIACANVSGVLLARATTRRREIAVRVSAGAARARLIRQLLTETLLLFLLGGGLGLLLARGLTTLLVSILPSFEVPIALSVPLDTRVAAFSLGLSLVAALLSGLAPALHGSRSDVVTALKDDAHDTPERLRLRHAFVVAQVACSLLLIVTAGLLVRALERVNTQDRGYDPAGVDAASVQLAMGGYTSVTGARFTSDLIARVRALPAIRTATLSSRVPGPGAMSLGGVSVPGVSPPSGLPYFYPSWTLIDSDYFETLSVRLLDGRDFTNVDDARSEPVVILGRRAADLFWGGERAIGRYLTAHGGLPDAPGRATLRAAPPEGTVTPEPPAPVPMRVVGVVEDVNSGGPPEIYVPLRQRYWSDLTILARHDGGASVASDLRALVTSMDPDLPVLSAGTLSSMRNGPVETQFRVAAAVAGGVGAVGLLLAALGIYGVTAYTVTRRTREIGIRLSMGARPGDIMVMVLRQATVLIAVGTGIGLALGVGAGRVLAGQRFGVPPPDFTVLAGAAVLFAFVGLVASYVPVRRAVRIQAMDALRYE